MSYARPDKMAAALEQYADDLAVRLGQYAAERDREVLLIALRQVLATLDRARSYDFTLAREVSELGHEIVAKIDPTGGPT